MLWWSYDTQPTVRTAYHSPISANIWGDTIWESLDNCDSEFDLLADTYYMNKKQI